MKETLKDGVVGTGSPEKTLWVYGYEMIPPHLEDRMTAIRDLLTQENDQAKRDAKSWTARLVTEKRATHVLIVSADPTVDLPINRKLEADLRALGVSFRVTVPMSLKNGDPESDPKEPRSGGL